MTARIREDHKKFRDVVSGRYRKELGRLVRTGAIVRERPKGGRLTFPVPQIDIPHFVHGDTGEGVGRGPGKDGEVIGRDPQPGNESGAGKDDGEGILISADLDDVLKFMEEELHLPQMKPKPNEMFEEVKVRYTNISKVGLNSLRHIRRTMKEAIKRQAMMGGFRPGEPPKPVTPVKSDFRYRQWKEVRIPSSNAVIFFARDCSGSMDKFRCDIVSDMCWWLDCWIRKFYDRVDRCYFVHDTRAEEVDAEKFYNYRYGGGTTCSSAFEAMAHQFENRYPPNCFNIYVFYFTDGDNIGGDNARLANIIREKFGPEVVNLVGITQVCPWTYDHSVKHFIDDELTTGKLSPEQVKTVDIGATTSSSSGGGGDPLSENDRNQQIIDGIRKLLSPARKGS